MYKVKYTAVGTLLDSDAVHFSKSPKKAWSLAEKQAEESFDLTHTEYGLDILGKTNSYLGASWEMWKGHRLIAKSDWSD
tara:strand:- start:719 stop:955 length:237 start_codon:yes stop_codon:yes gene_type:complete